jgi:hypothetical protein
MSLSSSKDHNLFLSVVSLVAVVLFGFYIPCLNSQSAPTATNRSALQSSPRLAPRITADITRSEMAPLQGSQHPLALPQNDAGRMAADTRLNGISLYFNRSRAQQADLEALLAAQQDPSSPQYHQWLTPDQFAARFGVAQSDIDQVQSWLQREGFSIDSIARSHNMIRFSGTVNQVEQAFSTQMHYYQSGGTRHFAPSGTLSVPAAISPVVAGFRNLNNFRPRPQHVTPRAAFTSGQSHNVYFAPGDIATVYDVTPLYSASINGTGQTIAVAGQSAIQVTDVENFQSASGLTKKDPTLVLVPGTGDSTVVADGDEGESDLDVEWSGALAPGANIVFVYTGSNNAFGVFDSVQYAVDELIAPIISLSYASCETELTTSSLGVLDAIMQQAATQGQSIITASGDQGSTACSGDTHLTTAQQEAVAVNYPASSAYVTGMGGTEITSANSTATNTTYWTGGSSTSDTTTSAIKYIPEVAWNDDSAQGGLSASGGGTSTLVNRPSWQSGVPGIPSGSMRLLPDISLYSSPQFPGYLYCTSDVTNWAPASGTQPAQQASCNSGFRDSSTNYLTVAGGTSFAAPIFAGMLALINQNAKYTNGQGLINPTLYKLAADSATYASAFHDITQGNNNCTAGSGFCSATTGFSAGTGYDEVTGLGSVDLSNLAAKWPVNATSSAGLIATTTAVVPANATPDVNVADTFTITVAEASGSGTPTGTVTLKIDGGTDCGGLSGDICGGTTLSNQALSANGTLTYSATFTTTGTHSILAQYSGDATHSPSTGVGSVIIGTTSSGKGTITMSATNVTVSQGSSANSTITVTPAGGYTGTVLINITNTSNNNALSNLCYQFSNTLSSGQGSVAVTGTAAVTTQLTLDSNANDCPTTTGVSRQDPPAGTYSITVTGVDSVTSTITSTTMLTLTINPASTPPPVIGGAQGAYFGTASNGEAFETIILPNNTPYALYGFVNNNMFNILGMITGAGTSTNGTYSASIADYYYTGATYAGSVSASYVSGSSISGTITDSGVGTLSFSGSALPTSQYNYNSPASISPIVGTWNGALFGGVAASANITSSGKLTGSSQGCSFSGSISPDPSGKNFFDFSLTYGSSNCVLPNQSQTGIVVDYLLTDGVTRQLIAALASGSTGNVFVASRVGGSPSATYSLVATSPTVAAGSSGTSTITISSTSGYAGTITLSCTLTSSPTGAKNLPSCLGNPTVNLSSSATSGVANFTLNTTEVTSAMIVSKPVGGRRWTGMDSGAGLAVLLLLGVPKGRRRYWRSMLGIALVVAVLGGITACSGGSNSGGGGGTSTSNPGTTTGTYTFTVTGIGNDTAKTTETTTFTLSVN